MTIKNDRDHHFMARALELAGRGRYTTHPNPRVGCVIVQGDAVVGEGWHERAGEAHAEVRALEQAGKAAGDATVYVTLEPCCYQGRTPPCTSALIAAGVTRVVNAAEDPHPRVAGKGLRTLKAAGIKTHSGVLESEAKALNAGFISRMRRGRPWVRLKVAMSLDGRTAMASGESRWITHEPARRDVHRQRGEAGAVLVGVNTVLRDDPQLNVRLPGEWRQPDRVILDTQARTPLSARMLGQPGRTLILTAAPEREGVQRLSARGAQIVHVPAHDGRLDLNAGVKALAELEVNTLLVEAGPRLAGALVQAELADELLLYVAPDLLGDEARGLVHLPGVKNLADRVKLRFLDLRRVGPDLRLVFAPEKTT